MFRLYRELWRAAAGARLTLVVAFLMLAASQFGHLAKPWLAARAIDTLQLRGASGLDQAAYWLLALLGAVVGTWTLHGPGRILERNVALRVRSRVADELLQALFRLPLAWHDQHHSAESAHRVSQSSGALYDFAQSQFIYLQNAVGLVGPLVALWLVSPAIGLAALVGFALIACVTLMFDRRMVVLAYAENTAERRYQAGLMDALGKQQSLRALRLISGMGRLVADRLEALFIPLRRGIVLNEAKWCSVDVLGQVLCWGLVAAYVWESAAQPGTSAVALGGVFMVHQYAQQASGVATAIAAHFQGFARQLADFASGDAIREARPDTLQDAAPPPPDWQHLTLVELEQWHAHGTAPALQVHGLRLERGRRYALMGGSGAGKSTLLRALAGLYPAHRCRLQPDAAPMLEDEAARAWLRTRVTLVPQDTQLIEGSLADNLAPGEALDDLPLLQQALDTARVSEFAGRLPEALTRCIAEGGANWSGGQRQRVALARGLYAARGCHLLLLDEPSSALDPATEAAVIDGIFERFPQACIVASIHRPDLAARFDAVIRLEGGRWIETH